MLSIIGAAVALLYGIRQFGDVSFATIN